MEILEAKVNHDFFDGVVCGKEVATSKKLYKDAKHFYKSMDTSLNDDVVMYEVYSYSQGDPKKVGNLNWGLTVMKPVYVNGECNITRGHFHENLDCAEFYFCLGGEGLLLMMEEDGHCYAEKMSVGTVHHIDGRVAHRLVNTGSSDLKVGACWPTVAGHDYARIEKNPFKVRIFKEDGNLVFEDRKEG